MTDRFSSAAAPVGRFLLSAIFLMSGIQKLTAWQQTAEQMQREGMAAVPLLLAGAVVFELGGSVLLLLGYKTRFAALVLIVFLIPTTLIFHDFWQYTGAEQQNQMSHFAKNLAILGGLLLAFTFGPGCCSVDQRQRQAPQ